MAAGAGAGGRAAAGRRWCEGRSRNRAAEGLSAPLTGTGTPEGGGAMRRVAAVAAGVVVADQALKLLVVDVLDLPARRAIDVLPPVLNLRMAWNEGINFGLFASEAGVMRWLLVTVAVAIAAVVWRWVWRAREGPRVQLAAGLLVGGAAGNVIDRLRWGAVADFLNMSCCGIDNPFAFNLADVAIFAGAVGLVLFAGRTARRGG